MESSTTPPPPEPPSAPPPAGQPPSGAYPVRFDAQRQDEYHRFLPLVKWLLAFPHYIVLIFVGIGAFLAIVAAWFAVLFTGRYPRGLFDFVVGTYRWGMRVTAYVYLLTDEYPPFSLGEEPGYPVQVEIEYPEHVDRWRPLVAWLLAFPYLLVAGILSYLAGIVAFIGIFVILFTRELPQGMFSLIVNPLRWQLRGNAYALWLVTRYPPFEWED
jgi:Domain of unknown function (DUF4389)